jgi:hypothetical protein
MAHELVRYFPLLAGDEADIESDMLRWDEGTSYILNHPIPTP